MLPIHVLRRDLKPLNIFVTSSDDTKLGDFGLARQKAMDRMSRVGTPCYREGALMTVHMHALSVCMRGLSYGACEQSSDAVLS